jgi:hypothetical protein
VDQLPPRRRTRAQETDPSSDDPGSTVAAAPPPIPAGRFELRELAPAELSVVQPGEPSPAAREIFSRGGPWALPVIVHGPDGSLELAFGAGLVAAAVAAQQPLRVLLLHTMSSVDAALRVLATESPLMIAPDRIRQVWLVGRLVDEHVPTREIAAAMGRTVRRVEQMYTVYGPLRRLCPLAYRAFEARAITDATARTLLHRLLAGDVTAEELVSLLSPALDERTYTRPNRKLRARLLALAPLPADANAPAADPPAPASQEPPARKRRRSARKGLAESMEQLSLAF